MNGFHDRVREPIAVGCHPPLAVPFRYLLRNLWRSAFATAWSNRCGSVLSVAPCTRFLVGGRADLLEHRAAFDFQRPCRWSDKFLEVLVRVASKIRIRASSDREYSRAIAYRVNTSYIAGVRFTVSLSGFSPPMSLSPGSLGMPSNQAGRPCRVRRCLAAGAGSEARVLSSP